VSGLDTIRDERLLTFEVAGAAYALPIADVLEVSEVARIGRVPGLQAELGGVMQYHGDALPVVTRAALFDVGASELPEPQHVVVVAGDGGDVPRLGLPVDRVLGLVDAVLPATRSHDEPSLRMPLDGRVTGVLNAELLVRRAAEVVARAEENLVPNPEHGGET
jgi:chemotaxis protein histidine kinase CheA